MTWQAQAIAFALGVAFEFLAASAMRVARPWVDRWRARHAIAYRAVARRFEQRWPGAPDCICWPDNGLEAGCVARQHRVHTLDSPQHPEAA